MLKVIHEAVESLDTVLSGVGLTILTNMAKHQAANRRDFSELGLDIGKIYDVFQKSTVNDPLLSCCACGLLSEII
jgi:hypothetical protein